jgi:hypothetical protein
MNRLLNISVFAMMLVLLSSCSSPFSYFGKTYPATENPEMFFREADVKKEFEVMGKLQAEMPADNNSDKMQRKVMREAAKRGADAVLIDNFDLTTGGFTSGGVGGGKRGKKGGSVGVSTSSTKVKKNINVEATLIKYKK